MKEEIIKQGMDRLDALAAKIGVTIETLWPCVVNQQLVDGYLLLGVTSVFILLAIYVFYGFGEIEDKEDKAIARVVLVIIVSIVCIILFCKGFRFVMNPEYWALQDITDWMK